MNPLIAEYVSLCSQNKKISRIHYVANFKLRFHPVEVIFYCEDGFSTKVDLTDTSESSFREFESELRNKWKKDHALD